MQPHVPDGGVTCHTYAGVGTQNVSVVQMQVLPSGLLQGR